MRELLKQKQKQKENIIYELRKPTETEMNEAIKGNPPILKLLKELPEEVLKETSELLLKYRK